MESKVYVGLIDPQSPCNVGAVMRAAGCYRVNEVFYNGSRYNDALKYSKKVNSNTQKEGKAVPLTWKEDLMEAINDDVKIVCVDLIVGATPLPEFIHPEKAIYIFGSENGTVLQDIIDRADAVVYVPTVGCMNLAASVNVLLYDRLAKSSNRIQGDELIISSRDQKNHRKIKELSDQQESACATNKKPKLSPSTAAEKLLNSYYKAMNRHSIVEILTYLDENIVVTFPETERNWKSLSVATTKFEGMFEKSPKFIGKFDVLELLAANESNLVTIKAQCSFACASSGMNSGRVMEYVICPDTLKITEIHHL